MRSRKYVSVILGMIIMLALSGCSNKPDASAEKQDPTIQGTISVYVVNYPLKYFAQRIGGEHVDVHFPAPADEDPAYWMPAAKTIGKYQRADLILLNGAGYAKWVKTASLPKSKLCNTSAVFTKDYIAFEDAGTHSHEAGDKHIHGRTAFTTWLDPLLAVKQADAVREALAKLQPQRTDAFDKNYQALKGDLEALDKETAEIVAKSPKRTVIFSHPVYQYFIWRYSINSSSVHWEPDEPPTEAMWTELKELLAKHPAKWMIWEGEPIEATKNKLAQRGLQSTVFNPCGNTPTEGDYLAVQRKNLGNLSRVFTTTE